MSDLKKYLSDGWTTDQLVNLVDVRVSNVDKKSLDHEPPVRLCNYMDVYSNDYITSNIDFMNATADKSQISKFVIKKGDVMITKDSETPDDIGIAAVSLADFEDVVCGYHLALFKPYKDKICGEFLAKQLGQYEVNRQFANKANGSTRYGLTLNVIKTALIPFPVSVEKQQKIAYILTTCDTVIEQTQSAIAKYKAIKQGLLHDLFTRGLDANGHLRPSYPDAPELYKESELGMIPKEWEVKRISELIKQGVLDDIQDGNHGEIHPKSDDFVSVGIPFIMASDISKDRIDFENCNRITEKQYHSLRIGFSKSGDILLSHKASIGFVARVPNFIKEIMLTPQVTYYRVLNENILSTNYLEYFMRSGSFQNNLQLKAKQSTRDYIGITMQKTLYIAFPEDLKEQLQIANTCQSIQNKIQTEETLLQKYQSIKRGLMGDLLGGKKTVGERGNAVT